MKLSEALNIQDFYRVAKRRLPAAVMGYFEGGVEDEQGLARNEAAYRQYRLLPRYLVDVSKIDQTATLFGRRVASPFGIAPTAGSGYLRPGADRMLAQAAAEANLAYAMSNLSHARVEDVARIHPHMAFQLYGAKDRKISEDMIRRARDAGVGTLFLTVDVPVTPKRERELRNRIFEPTMPLRNYVEALRHPAWLWDFLRHGKPVFENWAPYFPAGLPPDEVFKLVRTQFPVDNQTWRDLEAFRRLWPGNLVLKGIMHPADAVQAAEMGVNGIVISNHGARQLDRAPAALEVLPAICTAVGHRLTVMLDGGVRRGADIVTAWALGARFVWVGRPTVYGVAAFGLPGARRAIGILQQEVEITMKQIGCTSLAQLGPQVLLREGSPLQTER